MAYQRSKTYGKTKSRSKAQKRSLKRLVFHIKHKFVMGFLLLSDALKAIVLSVYVIILGPLMLLNVPLTLGRYLLHGRVLWQLGLLSKVMQVAIDWRLGQLPQAAAQMEEVMLKLESHVKRTGLNSDLCHVMARLYTILVRAYLHAGMMDQAMAVVLRAKVALGGDFLHELTGLDARSAQIIRAGLSAGRFLENGGMTTMVIRADREPQLTKEPYPIDIQKPSASKDEGAQEKEKSGLDSGKIIPFPSTDG